MSDFTTIVKSKLVLSVSPSWLSPGASVTLSCEVKPSSAGWRFFWYKAVPEPSSSSYSFDLMPGSTNGTEQNSFLINGQNHTAGYVCRAGRGEPVIYTDYRRTQPQLSPSPSVTPPLTLWMSPDRVQHFLHQSVTLNCTGNKTQWRVKSFPEPVRPSSSQCSWRTMTGSSCTINLLQHHSGVYWCEFGSGDFSNAVNITVHSSSLNATEIRVTSVKPHKGFYKCQHSGKESPQSWMAVRERPRARAGLEPRMFLLPTVQPVITLCSSKFT
uniref:Ig-like domain-containing protein n=1 Tax=Fundulus heteroclitus TaxID=8078 RepID=A0A3Q2Q4G9_FUNHE